MKSFLKSYFTFYCANLIAMQWYFVLKLFGTSLRKNCYFSTAQKQKSRTIKSPLMLDWVFRLGLLQKLFQLILSCFADIRFERSVEEMHPIDQLKYFRNKVYLTDKEEEELKRKTYYQHDGNNRWSSWFLPKTDLQNYPQSIHRLEIRYVSWHIFN